MPESGATRGPSKIGFVSQKAFLNIPCTPESSVPGPSDNGPGTIPQCRCPATLRRLFGSHEGRCRARLLWATVDLMSDMLPPAAQPVWQRLPLCRQGKFANTYDKGAVLYLVVTKLALTEWARAFKAVSPGMLPPLGILFALLVGFIAVDVWSTFDKAKAAVATEASALRAVVLLAGTFPKNRKPVFML